MASIEEERKKLFSNLKQEAISLWGSGGADLIPHQIISHGFMKWKSMVVKTFPGLRWRGKKKEEAEGFSFTKHGKFLYNRFFIELVEEKVLEFPKSEIKKWKKQGWKEYLED